MIIDFILLALGIYFIYKVVFELIIPVVKTTRNIRQTFSQMQQPGNQQRPDPQGQPEKKNSTPSSSRVGEYIDFEEVK